MSAARKRHDGKRCNGCNMPDGDGPLWVVDRNGDAFRLLCGSCLREERDSALAAIDNNAKVYDEALSVVEAEMNALLDWCKAWLIRARLAIYREGWEEGMSEKETADALTSVLFNLRCDDGSGRPFDIAETKRLLAMTVTYCPPECTHSGWERKR